MSLAQLTVSSSFNRQISVSAMLIVNAIGLTTVGAFGAFADVTVNLDEQTLEQQIVEQPVEEQVGELAAIAHPNPFLGDSSSLEVLSPEVPSPEVPSPEVLSLEIPIVEERQEPLFSVVETIPEQTASDRDRERERNSELIAQSAGEEAPPKFGQAGKQRWYVQGGVGADFDDDLFGLVGGGVSHFVFDNHSINLELNGLAVDQQNNNAVGLNLALLVRSHWIRGENWSIYIDGGAGLLTTNNDVPDAGSSFNFTPQIGGGATFAVNDTQRIMTGLRWYHISNANTFDANPGLDTVYGYVGYNFPF